MVEVEAGRESHARLLAHFRAQRDDAARTLEDVAAAVSEEPAHVRFAAAVLERLPDVWRGAGPEARDGLVGSIWPGGLVLDGGRCRTASGESLIGLLGGVRAENGAAPVAADQGRPIRLPY